MIGGYSPTVALALFGSLPAGLVLVNWLGPRRGVIAIFLLGWLLLPMAGFRLAGLPDYTKISAIPIAAALAVVAFDSGRLLTFRPQWIDIPMVVWCCCPFVSSVTNGLGAWDGFATVVNQLVTWGLPYFVGRLYFTNAAALRDLAVGVVLGGLLYVPLCLYEIRMSPQLHSIVYGYHQHQFLQSMRFGGWRPTVFLQHGLAVGLYMSSATLAAVWLWRRRTVTSLLGIPMSWIAGSLGVVTILCKSTGSIMILAAGLAVLWLSRVSRARWPIYAMLATIPLYMTTRALGVWSGEPLLEWFRIVLPDRALSLQARLNSEDFLAARAIQRPVFGWGGWGRNLIGADGKEMTLFTDGLWIITFGKTGVVGIASMTGAALVPVIATLRRIPRKLLHETTVAPMPILAMLIIMFMLDCLFNAMPNPAYILAAGGLASASVGLARRRPRGVARRAAGGSRTVRRAPASARGARVGDG